MNTRPTSFPRIVAILATVAGLGVSTSRAAAPVTPTTDTLAAYGAVGFAFAEDLRLRELQWTPAQLDAFIAGLRASYAGIGYPTNEKLLAEFELLRAQIRRHQQNGPLSPPSDVAQPQSPPDDFYQQMRWQFSLQTSDSGLLYRLAKPGSGPRPRREDFVTVSFQASSPDAPSGLPKLSATHLRIKVSDLMPGLAEGVQLLAADGALLLLVPPGLSFGHGAWPEGIEPGTPLMFGMQLHDIAAVPASP